MTWGHVVLQRLAWNWELHCFTQMIRQQLRRRMGHLRNLKKKKPSSSKKKHSRCKMCGRIFVQYYYGLSSSFVLAWPSHWLADPPEEARWRWGAGKNWWAGHQEAQAHQNPPTSHPLNQLTLNVMGVMGGVNNWICSFSLKRWWMALKRESTHPFYPFKEFIKYKSRE